MRGRTLAAMVAQPDPFRVPPPAIAAPRPFVERRRRSRRAADQLADEERLLLAHALDVLARDAPAEERLADLLGLVAQVAGASRAAVLAEGPDRRVAVAIGRDEDPAAGDALAAWLDAHAARTRTERAAAGPAPVAIVRSRASPVGSPVAVGMPRPFAIVEVPGAGGIHLGFELPAPAPPAELARRFPGALARHAAIALALVTAQVAEEAALAALRAAEGERARFVSTVAHELRAPLAGLGGYLDLILDGRVGDDAVEREFLERSRAIVGGMGNLVGDLLERAQLEAGSLRLETAPFSLADACARVRDGLEPVAAGRQVHLVADLPARIRTAVADGRRVEQACTNLVANACKFAPPGGLVEIAARFVGPVAIVVVRDDGPGIPPDDRERIFEPFARLAEHERVAGTGLGLPIARDLARAMGGDLGVASVPGSGSAFVLALPAVRGTNADAIAGTLADVLEAEEVGLEERAVLRAIHATDRRTAPGATAPRPPAAGAAGPTKGAAAPAGRAALPDRPVPPPAAERPLVHGRDRVVHNPEPVVDRGGG